MLVGSSATSLSFFLLDLLVILFVVFSQFCHTVEFDVANGAPLVVPLVQIVLQ